MQAQVLVRHLSWQACYNTRDLGGYHTSTGAETRWRRMIRSDSLHRLTPEGEAALRAYDIRTVMDLRTPQEVAATPYGAVEQEVLSIPSHYLHIPIVDEQLFSGPQGLHAIDSMADLYQIMLDGRGEHFAAVVRPIARTASGAVVFYCNAGKDRTGLVTALLLALVGVPHSTIAEDYALSDQYLQPFYEEIRRAVARGAVRLPTATWLLQSLPETMVATLAHLEQTYGGVEAYLSRYGITGAEIEQVRMRLLT